MNISIVCYKSKVLANGDSPLMVQISKDGKRKYQSLGVSINPKQWDFKKNKPKPTCINGDFIQQIILNKVSELQKQVLSFKADNKTATISNILNNKPKVIEKTVGEFYKELIAGFEQSGKIGNGLVYRFSLNSIRTFAKGKTNFLFSDIDLEWLNRYEKWLRSKGNNGTTLANRFRTLRSAYNKAIQANSTSKDNYPFEDFKVSKFKVKTKKRAVPKDEILKIMKVDLSKESESVQLARDIFVFSYLSGGINFTDIANLKPDNIVDGQLTYSRQKTGKIINVQLLPNANLLIEKHKDVTKITGYLFPILKMKNHKTAQQRYNRIHKILLETNEGLKRVALLCGIKSNLTTYVARHSFATVLKNSGVNIALISEALGHSELSTTQIYLDSFNSEQTNEAMKNLL